jgi:exopolysaccharide biosynthesis operon protein EpsL
MFSVAKIKKIPAWYCLFFSSSLLADGIFTLNPYVSSSISYDDNLYRFSSSEQAIAVLGTDVQSDIIKRLDLGLQANLQLSRQMLTLSTNMNESKFNRNSNLNNTGKANSLRWDWRIASKLHGELSTGITEALSGFNEIRNTGKNIRTNIRKIASVNWDIHPDLSIYTSREYNDLENDLQTTRVLNRSDMISQSGVRYRNAQNTSLELAYRTMDSSFDDRTGLVLATLGGESNQKEYVFNIAWSPSDKTQFSTNLSKVSLKRPNSQLSDFSGFNQRWNLGYSFSEKLNLGFSAYRNLLPVDDVVSTFVKVAGYSFSPTWRITSKLNLTSNLSMEKRDYIDSAAFLSSGQDRDDESLQAGASLQYFPTEHFFMQVQYTGEKRTSNNINSAYQFNNLNLSLRYNF